jgi:hypothetical protein
MPPLELSAPLRAPLLEAAPGPRRGKAWLGRDEGRVARGRVHQELTRLGRAPDLAGAGLEGVENRDLELARTAPIREETLDGGRATRPATDHGDA